MKPAPENTEFVKRLLELERIARGFKNWYELAEDMDADPTTLWRWRSGQRLPSAETLIPLVKKHCLCSHHDDAEQVPA